MMIAVQTIRATARAVVSDSSMAAWAPPSHFASSASSSKMRPSSYLYAKKRDRDCFEAYDYQAHMQQKMRYSALREQPQCYNYSSPQQQQQQHREAYRYPQQPMYHHGSAVYPRRDSLEHQADVENTKRQRLSPPASNSSSSAAKIHNVRKTKACSKPKRPTRARMTRKNYNKKKLQEMTVATGRQLQAILATSDRLELPVRTLQRARYFRHKAEALDGSLRAKCNSIVQKERDIKAWLGMTTGKKEKIIKLRSRLHGRWAEVKDLQSEVKPKRQRLKNLKFAVMCEERSIEEEPTLE